MTELVIPRSWATDVTLSPIEVRVLLALAARGNGGPVAVDRLALGRWAGISTHSATKAALILEDRGLLKITRRPAEPCTYTVLNPSGT